VVSVDLGSPDSGDAVAVCSVECDCEPSDGFDGSFGCCWSDGKNRGRRLWNCRRAIELRGI